MDESEIEKHKKIIDDMSRAEMARLWRFAPSGHIYFRSDIPLHDYFRKKFIEKGGWNSGISKQIGLS